MVDDGCGPSEYLGIRLTGKCKKKSRLFRDAGIIKSDPSAHSAKGNNGQGTESLSIQNYKSEKTNV